MNGPDSSQSSDFKTKELSGLKEAWKLTQSSMYGFDPQIEEGFELDYYAGHTLLTIQLRINVLKKILGSRGNCDETERLVRELEWMEKDLSVIKAVLSACVTRPT